MYPEDPCGLRGTCEQKMEFWLVLLIILLILLAIVAARIVFEMTHPEVTHYSLRSGKLSANEKVRITYIADLHSRKYGKNNIRLIRMLSKTSPDFIVLGGDMLTASRLLNRDERTIDALNAMTNIAPVFYAPGNHEKKLEESDNPKQKERFDDYMFELECMDVTWLADQKAMLTEDMTISGLDIDLQYYEKFGRKPQMKPAYIAGKLESPDPSRFNILVAHTPAFYDTYIQTDYDLVLCGHYHGGVMNLPWIGPLISPDFEFRPEHSGGASRKKGTAVVVTRGIGSHTINIRLFNRPEVVVIDIRQE